MAELEVLVLAPGEEAANEAGVGAAGVGVRDTGGEELIGGEQAFFPARWRTAGAEVATSRAWEACRSAIETGYYPWPYRG